MFCASAGSPAIGTHATVSPMCGICGAVRVGGANGPALETARLEAMTAVMEHRGPDDVGFWEESGVAFGARRLSVIDVEGGHQPFANEGGDVVTVQNGELYNHATLRDSLVRDGHVLRSSCDTEILPHLYEERGVDFVSSLRGMFAVAIWDRRRRRAVLARDRLGVKPLYWTRQGDLVLFASELKSLLASGLVSPRLDDEAVAAHLQLGYVPAPRTLLRGVRKLLPGHRLVIEGDGVRDEAYWELPAPGLSTIAEVSENELAEELLGRLDESVRLRLMSDVPLGAMLSGGLDSSVIVGLMARHMTHPVQTFSIGFRDSGRANELADARLVAKTFGADHHELELSSADTNVDLAELVWHLDEPVADLSSLGFLALSRLAASHVTVALSGQGADELLGGYSRYATAAKLQSLSRVPAPLRRAAAFGAKRLGARAARGADLLTAARGEQWLVAAHARCDADTARRLLRTDGDPRLQLERAVAERLTASPTSAVDRALYADSLFGLADDMLHYFDRTSMAHSLEVRVPFLDHPLVEFTATIPWQLKVRNGVTKSLLKTAARGLVPDAIIDKPKIGFFNSEVDGWLRRQLSGVTGRYLLADDLRIAEFVDSSVVRELASDLESPQRSKPHLVLALLMLEVWLADALPRMQRPVPTSGPIRLPA
jgi:asparagine synthase (glutamine-hydrolysing)